MKSQAAIETLGNIPTCVGKTGINLYVQGKSRKHPHLRGENNGKTTIHAVGHRNIPTCVGKTGRASRRQVPTQKHPHLRGENSKMLS